MDEINTETRYFVFGDDLAVDSKLHDFFARNKELLPQPLYIKYIGDLLKRDEFKIIDPSELPLVKANENLSYETAYDMTDASDGIRGSIPVFLCTKNTDGSYSKDIKIKVAVKK